MWIFLIKKNNKKGGCLNISTLSNMTALGSKPLPGLNKNIFKLSSKHLQILHQGRAQDLKIPGALRNLPGTLKKFSRALCAEKLAPKTTTLHASPDQGYFFT